MLANSVCTTVNTKPLLKDLHNYIVPVYATRWRVIGTQLGLPNGRLDIIEYNHSNDVERCCISMLDEWLNIDTTASWGKMITVIESPAVSTPDRGDLSLYIVSYARVGM